MRYNALKYSQDTAITQIAFEQGKKAEVKFRTTISWFELDFISTKIAKTLMDMKIKKGDRIAILMENSIEWFECFFGILKIGAIVVPLNYNDLSQLDDYLTQVDCISLIYDQCFSLKAIETSQKCRIQFCVSADTLINSFTTIHHNNFALEHIYIHDNDIATIFFSSGTTSGAKAVQLTHSSLNHSAIAEQKHHNQSKHDVFLLLPPLYHTGAFVHWLGGMVAGSSTVILNNTSPEVILNTIDKEKISIVWLLLIWAQDILNSIIDTKNINVKLYDFSNWRLTHMGAQHIPASVILRWKECFPLQSYDTNYGLTEAGGPGCVHLGIENFHKIESIGKAGFGWQTKIIDENGKLAKKGDVGELIVKGPGIMAGYYNNVVDTNKVLINGWLRTGDLVYEDNDGYIYIVDRIKDMIISGGENISSIELENFIRSYHKVKDVAAIGIEDTRLGEVVAVIVEPKENYSCKKIEIFDLCKKIAIYKRPRKIIIGNVIRNKTGKIDKKALKKKYFS